MLTEQLASEIVKRTMSILHANVNVMDRTGTIIGSGEPNRIGELHDGARKVIDQQLTVEISSVDVDDWAGSRHGINLPIRFRGEIVGVIGITGEPEQIRSYSELVQMGAELTLEQAFLTKEIQRDQRLREDVISHILLGSESEQTYIMERARSFNINTNETYGVILISHVRNYTDEKLLKQIESWIKSWLKLGDELVKLYSNQFIVLKKKESPNLNSDEKLKTFMNQKALNFPVTSLTITLGPFFEGFEGWRRSYKVAQTLKETAEALYPNGGVWDENDLGLATLCYRFLKVAPEEARTIKNSYHLLFDESDGLELHQTFLTYVDQNGEMAKTAEILFIHRNTLAYRLEKIYAITGKNPKKVQDLIELQLGQILFSLSSDDSANAQKSGE